MFHQALPVSICNLELMNVRRARNQSALLVSLSNGEVRVYNERVLLHSIQINEPIIAMRFGSYSKEENALAVVTISGAVVIKMLQRSANLEVQSTDSMASSTSAAQWLPNMTQLHQETSQRENDCAPEIHRNFQVIFHSIIYLIS